eukprot:6358138-Amphidinium_carterae.1
MKHSHVIELIFVGVHRRERVLRQVLTSSTRTHWKISCTTLRPTQHIMIYIPDAIVSETNEVWTFSFFLMWRPRQQLCSSPWCHA